MSQLCQHIRIKYTAVLQDVYDIVANTILYFRKTDAVRVWTLGPSHVSSLQLSRGSDGGLRHRSIRVT